MRTIKKITSLLCAALLLFSLSACSLSPKTAEEEIPESTGGKDIEKTKAADNVLSLNSNKQYSLNPFIATNHSNQLICSLVYENMVEVDNNFEVHPGVVGEWYVSADGLTWEIYVAEGHTFHDGTAVTGRDLRFSLEKALTNERYAGRFAAVQGISFDDAKMIVYLGIADSQFIKLLNIPVIKSGTFADKYPEGSGPYTYVFGTGEETMEELMGTAVPAEEEEPEEEEPAEEGKADEKDKTDDKKKDGEAEEEVPAVTSTTDRKVAEENKLVPVKLVAFDGYPDYQSLPVDTIYIKMYTEAEEIIDAFEDSYIDITVNDPSSYSNLGYASSNEFRTFATTNMHYVAFNEEGTYGRYSNFRVAMQYAFDRSALVELLDGNAVEASLPMYPTCKDYPTMLAESINYDLEKSKLILENFGIKDNNGDGKMESMNSSDQVTLNFILCADSSAKSGIVQHFVSDMASIGIKVNVYSLTWDKFQTALEEGEVEVEVNTGKTEPWDMYYAEVKLRNNFDLTELMQVRDKDNEYSNINWTRSTDQRYLQYINDYLAAPDGERPLKFEAFAKYLTENASLICIGFEKQQLIAHRGVTKGLDPNAGNPLYGFPTCKIDLG